MRLTIFAPLATLLAVALAADDPNPFKIPQGGYSFTAGKPTTLNWTPTTGGTVTLTLRQGASNNLDEGTVIEANIPNDGSYTYTPPADTVRGSDYTIEISSDSDPTEANYSPYFVLESSNTVASQSADSASASETSAAATSESAAATTLSTAATSTGSSATTSSGAAASSDVSSHLASIKSAAASSSAAAVNSPSPTFTGPTSTSTGAGSEAGGSSAPSSGATLGAVGKLNVQAGFLAILLSAVAAW